MLPLGNMADLGKNESESASIKDRTPGSGVSRDMPLLGSQLKSDPAMQRLAAHSTFEFRTAAAAGWIVAVLGSAAIALLARGLPAWIAECASVLTAMVGFYRLQKENALLTDYATAVATVSQRVKNDGVDGGYSYSVKYRFLGPDGKLYLGESGTTGKELPEEGGTLPVLYRRNDPGQNHALATFWFFRFTYTGTD